jgi:hypothetical protein
LLKYSIRGAGRGGMFFGILPFLMDSCPMMPAATAFLAAKGDMFGMTPSLAKPIKALMIAGSAPPCPPSTALSL